MLAFIWAEISASNKSLPKKSPLPLPSSLFTIEKSGHSAHITSNHLYEPDSYVPLARMDMGAGDKAPRVYYFHCNASGQPEEMTDADGEVVWRARYATWGKVVFENITKAAPQRFEQNLRMQGQYEDRETGLYYNTFRYYDADVGRFTCEDPIGLLGGDNLYQYAPNPISWIDPWGWSNSGQLDRNLGGIPHDGMQAQHLIPVEVWKKHDQFFKDIGLDGQMNKKPNGVLLPDSPSSAKKSGIPVQHRGSHPQYSKKVDKTVTRIKNNYNAKRISANVAKKQITALQKSLRTKTLTGKISTTCNGRLC